MTRSFLSLFIAALPILSLASARAASDEDRAIADSLAAMLRAGRSVISESQPLINDPKAGPKGLTGEAVLARALAAFEKATGVDPRSLDAASRQGRLIGFEMKAIVEVMDANQATIDTPGMGFKGFIPAVFARLVSEAFDKMAAGEASIRVTAPPELVRNLKARPDAWEKQVIADEFRSPTWPKGQSYEAVVGEGSAKQFRIAVPEYYSASCLSCHGAPKGEMDITGYPKEGAKLGDLGGVISIELSHS